MISISFSLPLELFTTMKDSCMRLESSLLSAESKDPCSIRMITVQTMYVQESSLFCSLTLFKKQELAGVNGDLNRKAFHSGDRPFITSQRWTAQREPVGVMALNAVTTDKLGTLGLAQTTLHRLVSNIMVEVLSSYLGITIMVPSPKLSLKQPMTVI